MNIQILAFILATALGLIFIVRFSSAPDPFDTEIDLVPASPAYIDHKKILDSISKCTSIDQLRKLQIAADEFFDIHWKQIAPQVLQVYYADLMQAISNKSKELYAEEYTV